MSGFGCLALRYLFQFGDFFDIHFQKQDISSLSVRRDLPYIADGNRGHLFDVYGPKDADATTPTVINIHGGGLFAAYKEVARSFNYRWAKRGYNVVALSYRRLPDVTLPDQLHDVFAALSYVREHAQTLGLNMNDVFLTGDSAGALLSLFALAINNSEPLQNAFGLAPHGIGFKAANAISVMLDTVRGDMLKTLGTSILREADENKTFAKYVKDPALMIPETTLPPTFLITSAEDLIRNDTLKYKKLLDAVGVQTRLIDEPKGKTHKLVHVFPVKYSAYEESERVNGEVNAFFRSFIRED